MNLKVKLEHPVRLRFSLAPHIIQQQNRYPRRIAIHATSIAFWLTFNSFVLRLYINVHRFHATASIEKNLHRRQFSFFTSSSARGSRRQMTANFDGKTRGKHSRHMPLLIPSLTPRSTARHSSGTQPGPTNRLHPRHCRR